MLRSTEFFRSLECPFYGSGGTCNRPYCHFRHRGAGGGGTGGSGGSGGGTTTGSTGTGGDAREKPPSGGQPLATGQERGYDPHNLDLTKGSPRNGDEISDDLTESSSNTLELELVNQAIEAVRSEVEQEQQKLSRYGVLTEDAEEQYVPSAPRKQKTISKAKGCTEVLPHLDKLTLNPLEYNPDSYHLTNKVEYTPTPLSSTACSSKYTLDTDDEIDSKNNSLKYVPTLVTKPAKYTTSAPSHKYVIDNTKPCTDLEYDPLLNYSARLMSKNKSKEERGIKRARENSTEESYIPTAKKRRHRLNSTSCHVDVDSSASGDDLSDNDSLQRSRCSSKRRNASTEEYESDEGSPRKAKDLKKRPSKGTVGRCDKEDVRGHENKGQDNRDKHKCTEKSKSASHSAKVAKCSKEELGAKDHRTKKNKGRNSETVKDRVQPSKADSSKGKASDHREKVGIKEKKKCEKERVDIKQEQDGKKLKDKAKIDANSQVEKKRKREGTNEVKEEKKKVRVDGDSGNVKTGKLNGTKSESSKSRSRSGALSESSGKAKAPERKKSDKNINDSFKSKGPDRKNGAQIGSKGKEKLKRKAGESMSAKDKGQQKSSLSKHQGTEKKRSSLAKRALSHTDLFGDDSSGSEDDGQAGPSDAYDTDSDPDVDQCSDSSSNADETENNAAQKASSSSSEDEVDFASLEKDFDFESDPMEECLRIFNESKEVKNEDKGRVAKQVSVESNEEKDSSLTTLFPGQRRRISHVVKQDRVEPTRPVIRPLRRLTPQEVCYQRSRMAQQQMVQLAAAEKPVSTSFTNPGEKRRMAHMPNAGIITSPKQSSVHQKMGTSAKTGAPSDKSRHQVFKTETVVGMASKTVSTIVQKRIAHAPISKSTGLKRPTIPTEYGAKVPTNVRQRYLNVFIDECLKFCRSEQEAFDKGLSEEKIVYDRCTSRTVYLNVAVNTLKKLRSQKNTPTSPTEKTPKVCKPNINANKKTLSHEAMLGGRMAMKTSFTLNRSGKHQDVELKGASFYNKLKEYILTEEQLRENSYPRPHPEKPGVAMLFNQDPKKNNTDSSFKICCRCGTGYGVSLSGNCIRKEECTYHWGKLRRQKVPGGWETLYNCCSGAVGSLGCQTTKQHVQDGRKENLEGFMKTFEKPDPADENPGAFALDCEMCYTKQGLELTRLTVVNTDLKVVYDTFVKPDSKVVDYNTRFSGVTKEDLESTTNTIRDVQAVLLSMFSADTILIGHSLESDLFALKLIHSTVIDTAIVFPHRLGLPYKRALKTLMADYLKRIIQDNVEGHDSSEDAASCMELMIWRIKEDAKLRR
ncbi:RNA exonuclease 1 homolog [Callorhinchus milii]|uniref:RNA exonuclease 1 homolog n=1 Tax=Callorhinchus milii TaxID=7868 RepID=UPI001C3F93DD|nr:RNA exonuclease 1 homolog [Callorhinchus milii]